MLTLCKYERSILISFEKCFHYHQVPIPHFKRNYLMMSHCTQTQSGRALWSVQNVWKILHSLNIESNTSHLLQRHWYRAQKYVFVFAHWCKIPKYNKNVVGVEENANKHIMKLIVVLKVNIKKYFTFSTDWWTVPKNFFNSNLFPHSMFIVYETSKFIKTNNQQF